jgi:hypothetical protein
MSKSQREYLRDKKRAIPQVVSPTRIDTAGLFTQMQRYKAAAPHISTINESAGVSLEHKSGANVLATMGNAAICCGPAQVTTTVPGCCTVKYTPYPLNGYTAKKPDPPAINYPPVDPTLCHCP